MDSNYRRLPLMFDLSNPRDAAIWQELEFFVKRRQANNKVRDILERALCSSPVESEVLAAMEIPRARRPNTVYLPHIPPSDPPADEADVDRAVEALLGMFG